MADEIGRCRCPVCGSSSAHLRVSKKQLAYVTCNACNVQVMARSDRSDEKLRALHLAEPAPEPTPPAEPVREPVRTSEPPAPPAPAPTPAPAKRAGLSWGILR